MEVRGQIEAGVRLESRRGGILPRFPESTQLGWSNWDATHSSLGGAHGVILPHLSLVF